MKIYKKGNYIYLVNASGDIKQDHANEVKITKTNVANETYSIYSDDLGVNYVTFSELTQENGTPYDSVISWELWYAENTGFKAVSGGSGTGDMTKAIYDIDNDGIVDSAKKEIVNFINKSGSTITKGTIVYLKSTSSSANYPEVLKANATTESASSKTIGAVYDDVLTDAIGYIVTSGEVRNINTASYVIGDKLWLSTIDGQVTTTVPIAPYNSVFIGTVTRSQLTNGRILYSIQNGYELNELHNVLITNPQNNDVLKYDSATLLWKNKPL